ncbi:MAG: DUF3800 domain-containing protein [Bacteroidota bacterium]|nr:DUF3800 domain-containing protein [Bacteroidota bacterium]
MHILYVDESGDDGFSKTNTYNSNTTPTGFYIRTGIVIHDLKWHSIDKEIEKFRSSYKIPSDKELHATEILNGRHRIYKNKKPIYAKNWFGDNFDKKERKEILVNLCGLIAQMDLSIFISSLIKQKLAQEQLDTRNFQN